MKLIANSQLTGIYGTVAKDEEFNCEDEDVAKQLLHDGKARKPIPPQVTMETKVTGPSEVGPVQPFCDMSMPNPKPKPVAAASDTVLPKSKVPKKRAANPGGRGRRQAAARKNKRTR